MANEFTPTQTRILHVLNDGKRHHKDDLYPCIEDELADHYSSLKNHLSCIRKRLRPRGEDIIVELWERRTYYRWVRMLWPESRG